MIVVIHASGTSFKGVAAYLMHDANKAETTDRVAWTHTLNLANDHVGSAVNEMYMTAENAELLKAEAGVRAGGQTTKRPTKHISMSWSPDESPTQEQMISACQDYLVEMGWDEHQAIIVGHNDKSHAHCHILLNAIHGETGLKLDEGFEERRSQKWALDYELRMGRVLCEGRLQNYSEREDSPTRPAWMAFKNAEQEFEDLEKSQRQSLQAENPGENIPENTNAAQWKKLKEIQRADREAFFAQGKSEFQELRNSIYREVREEFREGWANYFHDRKNGGDAAELAVRKAELIAGQKAVLEERRDEACGELLTERKKLYGELLFDQERQRVGLRSRQEDGLETSDYFWVAQSRAATEDNFKEAAREVTLPVGGGHSAVELPAFNGDARDDTGRVRTGTDVGARIGEGIGFGLISFAESLIDGFVGAKPDPKQFRQQEAAPPPGPDPFEAAIKQGRERQAREQEEADEEWRQRQRGRDGE